MCLRRTLRRVRAQPTPGGCWIPVVVGSLHVPPAVCLGCCAAAAAAVCCVAVRMAAPAMFILWQDDEKINFFPQNKRYDNKILLVPRTRIYLYLQKVLQDTRIPRVVYLWYDLFFRKLLSTDPFSNLDSSVLGR